MRKFIVASLVLFLGIVLAPVVLSNLPSNFLKSPPPPCSQPIRWSIGTVDSRFGLTKAQFQSFAQKASVLWGRAYGKDLFMYDPEAKLSLSMVYDERQSTSSHINQLENQVTQKEKDLNPQIEQYKKDSTAFQQKVQTLNAEIQSWNAKGGAPDDVYRKLSGDQASLRQEAQRLNAVASGLNLSASQYNVNVENLNSTIDTFNQQLSQKPEEGLYKGSEDKIEIYFYNTNNELLHTLAHEMGHALGLAHVQDSKAIMYPMTSQIIKPSQEDVAVLNAVCSPAKK